MVGVEERKEMGLHKEGWVKLMDVLARRVL